MNKLNFRKEGERQIAALNGQRAKLLLHCCCAPCASACLEYLKDYFDITAYFYNPNIPEEEYLRRKAELERFLSLTGWADIMPAEHDESLFYGATLGYEGEKEGGARCKRCFELRLDNAAAAAKDGGYDFFATTLTLSPLKNAELLNKTGYEAGEKHGVKWLYSDFKKNDGYLRSLQLSREFGLYRQNYCGCVYSQRKNY